MNTKATLFGLTWIGAGAVALMVSCSGGTDSNDSSGGSSSGGNSTAGKAGAPSAGTTNNSSGSSSGGKGSGGTDNNTGGTRPMGGSANNNGGFSFGGNFDFGGAGPDPSDFVCDPVPQAGSACTPGAPPCVDGSNVCYCSMSKWICMGGGAGGAGPGQTECPATKPMSGADCGDVAGVCPYGQNMGCACYNGKWACL